MPFPQPDTAIDHATKLRGTLAHIAAQATSAKAEMESRDYSATEILDLVTRLRAYLNALRNIRAVPNIQVLLRRAYGDNSFVFRNSIDAVITAGVAALDACFATFQKDENGNLLIHRQGANHTLSDAMFTPTQTASLATALAALVTAAA